MCLTVCHQVFNSHERHIVFIGKLNTLWCTRHRAIVISQLTQYTSRFKACQRHQINSCFSMTATRQYTTCLSAKWDGQEPITIPVEGIEMGSLSMLSVQIG